MYQPQTTISSRPSTTLEDSKYTVAELLSSLANGEPSTPTSLSFMSGIPTGTTPTLTPTTLQSLESVFAIASEQQGGITTTTSSANSQRVSGFVPPLIDPIVTLANPCLSISTASSSSSGIPMVKQEFPEWYQEDSSLSEDTDMDPSPAKRPRGQHLHGASTIVVQSPYGASSYMSQGLTQATTGPSSGKRATGPRRYRNDEHLTPDESARRHVRRERNKMAAAKCRQRRVDLTNTLVNETEGLEDEQAKLEHEIHNLEQQKEQLEFLLEAHRPVCNAKHHNTLAVKKEDEPISMVVTSSVQQQQQLQLPTVTMATSTSAISAASGATLRPTTLPIFSSSMAHTMDATGVPITTPSSGLPVYTLSLDCMMDGHTGLTPLTGAPSCASQVQRTTSETSSSNSENLSSPTTLMAL